MSFNKWMMKNSPGSPGSICKNFGKVFKIKRRNNPFVDNNALFEEIIKARYPFMDYNLVKVLTSNTENSFLLFIVSLTIYQNKSNVWALEEQWETTINVIFEVADKSFSEFIDMDLIQFLGKSENILNTLRFQI